MNLSKTTITTKRLKLVPISEAFAEEIFREFTPEITRYMFPAAPKHINDTLDFIHSAQAKLKSGKELNLVILNNTTNEYLGGCGIRALQTPTPEVGIWIKKSAHGNKYGREAVKGLKEWLDDRFQYDYIRYAVDRNNISSRKIAESLGGIVAKEYKKKSLAGIELDEVEYWIYRGKLLA